MTHDGWTSLLDAALKSTALLAAAWGLATLLRGRAGRVHHRLWTATFLGILALGVLALPALDEATPAWRLARLPPPISPAPEPVAAGNAGARASGDVHAPGSFGIPGPGRDAATPEPRRLPDPGSAGLGRLGSVPGWAALWVLGTLAALARCGGGLLRAARVGRRARPLEAERWQAALDDARAAVGVRRPVGLLMSDEISTPMTGGWLRPRVLLPVEAAAWDRERLDLVLKHELVHVRRGDWPVQVLAQAAAAVYWPSPLVWLARRRLVSARERACDEAVLALGARPSDYAGHLLDIASSMPDRRRTPAAALAMIHRSQLEGRLMSILSPESSRRGGRLLAVLVSCLVAALVASLAAVELWADGPGDADPSRKYGSWDGEWTMHETFDDGLYVSMRSRGGGRLTASGELEIDPGATVTLETSRVGSRQRLEITRSDGGRTYAWSIDHLEKPFDDGARQWMDAVVSILADLHRQGALRGQEGALRGQIGALRGREGALRGQIGALRGREGAFRGQIGALRGRIGSLQGQIGALHGKAGALRGQIGALKGQIAGLNHQRRTLTQSDDRSAELARVDEQIDLHEERILALEAELASFDLESRVAEIRSRMADVDVEAETAEIERQIAELSVAERTAEIERQIAELRTDEEIAALQQEIEALGADEKIEAIAAGLEAKAARLHAVLDGLGC